MSSTLTATAAPEPSSMPNTDGNAADPCGPREPVLEECMAILTGLSVARRNAILNLLSLLLADTQRLAILFLADNPQLRDADIAGLIGVSPSSVSRMDRFQIFKASLGGAAKVRRSPSKYRINRGDRWPLDSPGW